MAVAIRQPEQSLKGRLQSARKRCLLRKRLLPCLTAAVGLTVLIGYVGLYAKITQNGYHRAKLMSELRAAKTENQYLHAELRMLSCPDRLAAVAVQAGMVPSEKVQFVRVPTPLAVAQAENYE